MSPGGLHILIVDPLFRLPSAAGPSRSHDLALPLLRAGHRVTILAAALAAHRDDLMALAKSDPRLDIRVFDDALAPARFGSPAGPQRFDRGARFAAREVGAIVDLDVALIAHPSSGLGHGAMAACRRRETPFILDERIGGPGAAGLWAVFRFRRRRRGAFAALAASPDIRGWLAARLGERLPIVISPAGADTEFFSKAMPRPAFFATHPRLTHGPLVVFAGSLSPNRPFGRLLAIVAAMRREAPEVSFVICGDGPIRLDLNLHAARLDLLERNLWFTPALPRQALPGLLAAATVVLAFGTEPETPLSEPGHHLYDGLAAGKPIAVLGGGWQRDLIEARQAGVVLPVGDGAAAARELTDFLRDGDLIRRAGEQAAALARGRINTQRILGDVRGLLERAAAEQPRAAVVRRKLLAHKRSLDIAVATVLLVGLSPLWLGLLIAGGLMSRRWPIEGIECIGLKGRPFRRWRFVATINDALGRFGLDIGPALINVLSGSMSLVGPDTHPSSYVQFYSAQQQRRLDLRPGLTAHGATRAADWDSRFADDLWYVEHVTTRLDMRLIGGAIWRTITGRRRQPDAGLAAYDEVMARSQGAEDV